jgi:hypothetical protein
LPVHGAHAPAAHVRRVGDVHRQREALHRVDEHPAGADAAAFHRHLSLSLSLSARARWLFYCLFLVVACSEIASLARWTPMP